MARSAVEQVGAASQPWLIVFDNAANPDALRYLQPVPGTWVPAGSARVLITSRWSDFSGIAETTRLDQWSVETTADYLMQETGRDDRAGAEALARALGGLPLAADQAAGYLRRATDFSFADYAADIDRFVSAGAAGRRTRRLRADRLRDAGEIARAPPMPEATVDLLCLLSWLSPDGTEIGLSSFTGPKSVLNFCRRRWPPRSPTSCRVRDDAIAPLDVLSLLAPGEGRSPATICSSLHRMTATVLRVWQHDTGRPGRDARAAQIVDGLFPDRVS